MNISTGVAVSAATISAGGRSTTSNTSGLYTLNSLPAGSYTVTVSKSGWLSQSKSVTVSSGATATLNFSISTAGRISGTVKNAAGTGVSGATVTFKGGTLSNTISVKTSSTGAYSSVWIPVGSYTATVTLTGHTTQTKSATVTTGATTTLNFTGF
jgi:hypothetical protein